MRKNILSVIFGIVVSFVVIMVLEGVNGYFFPAPEGMNYKDPVAVKEYISTLPNIALYVVIFAHFCGAFAGGFVIGKQANDNPAFFALILGIVLLIATVANWMSIPHPEWFKIVDTLVILPGVWLGAKVVTR